MSCFSCCNGFLTNLLQKNKAPVQDPVSSVPSVEAPVESQPSDVGEITSEQWIDDTLFPQYPSDNNWGDIFGNGDIVDNGFASLPVIDDDLVSGDIIGDGFVDNGYTGDGFVESYPVGDDNIGNLPVGDDYIESYPAGDDYVESYPAGDDYVESYPAGDSYVSDVPSTDYPVDENPDVDLPDVDVPGNDISGGEAIVFPETYDSTHSPLPKEDNIEDDFIDIGDIEDDLGSDRLTATSLIQKEVEHVEGRDREFNVDVNNVAYEDFRGLGSNVFPCNLTDEAHQVLVNSENWDYDNVNFEIEADRWMTIKPHFNRMWFDIHWFATDEEENYDRKDIENNKDYQNYLNRKYDYDSDYMESMYKYLQVWQDAGSITALNYSWKVGERIQEWFNFPNLAKPETSAPFNLDAYAISCVDLLKYLREEKGFTSIQCVTFYNEPHYDGDFSSFIYEPAYWVAMVKRVEQELTDRGMRDDIEVWATEHGSIQKNPLDFSLYVRDYGSEYVDMWAFHAYYSSGDDQKADNYGYWYHFWAWMIEEFGKRIYVTETYASSPTYGTDMTQQHSWRKWTDSRGSQLVATANVGLFGILDWGMTGGYVSKPVGFTPSDGSTAAWEIPRNDAYIDRVQHNFYDEVLLTNYIPAHSDVLMVDWTGDDIHGSAFKLPDGNYTILIDAAGNIDTTIGTEYEYEETTERDITFNLSGLSKDVTFYKYSYDPDEVVLNPHATIPVAEEKMTTDDGVFKDTIDKDYGMYLYTTMAPVKQIEIESDSLLHKIAANEPSYDFDAKLIDCEGEIEWSITVATDGMRNDITTYGSIDKNGVYTPDPAAKEGDKIAIRATLKSDPKVFDVVMIRIEKNK